MVETGVAVEEAGQEYHSLKLTDDESFEVQGLSEPTHGDEQFEGVAFSSFGYGE